jgi:plasmid maintenance system antidote protein VapI
MAIGLGRLSGTSPHIRFGLQQARDLWRIERALAGELKLIPTHALPPAIRNDIEQPHGP